MQFVVFAAFALVLSIPLSGPPHAWVLIRSPSWTWAAVIGQVALAAMIGAATTWRVRAKLDRDPAWLPGAQRRLAQGNAVVRVALLVDFVACVFLTDWANLVRRWKMIEPVWGLDELLILVPFLAAILASWLTLYPADRAIRRVALELRLWASVPARPPWTRRAFLSFMFRQHVLIIAIPMIPILVANDFVQEYARQLRRLLFNLAWADQAVLVAMAGLVFLIAPVFLRYIWHTRVLPAGDLRSRLDALCHRVGLTYRRILIWESDGMVVNAAVMGLVRPVRYVLLSDGLLEMMDDAKIEAVFGHEAGHVKCRHIQYYLLFAVLSMLIVGGVMELVVWASKKWPAPFASVEDLQDYLQVGAMGLILAIWLLGFGAVSRRFELQADLFGARSVTPSAAACNQPCVFHGTASLPPEQGGRPGHPVCASAAGLFADALHQIAVLNGIPIEARSWRHSSIANRIKRLQEYGLDPTAAMRLDRAVGIIKAILLLGTVVGLAIAAYLYWPKHPFR